MKKLFLVFMSLMFIMCLVGCDDSQDKITVNFIIDGKSHLVEIDKDTSINKEIIPLSNNEQIIELYYDADFSTSYEDEKISENTDIYVKLNNLKEGEFVEINYTVGLITEDNIFRKNFSKKIIKSFDEWKSTDCNMNEINLKYTEDFFVDNCLLIYRFEKNVRGNEFVVNNVLKDNLHLIVKINLKEGYIDALSDGTIILELLQKDVYDINDVIVEEQLIE